MQMYIEMIPGCPCPPHPIGSSLRLTKTPDERDSASLRLSALQTRLFRQKGQNGAVNHL